MVTLAKDAGSYGAAEAAKIQVGPVDILNGKAGIVKVVVVGDVRRVLRASINGFAGKPVAYSRYDLTTLSPSSADIGIKQHVM